MRACVRVALISVSVPASFGLAGCAAIDELRDTILRWVESERLPSGRGTFADDMPDATPVVPPEKPAKKEASKIAKKQGKSVRDLRRPQSVALPPKKPPIPDSPERIRPDETEGQSAPPASMRLRTQYPEAPPPGVLFTLRSPTNENLCRPQILASPTIVHHASATRVDELEFLIRTQCLAESEAADRRAVGCAIARAVTQN